jgi:hypothetical protein
MTIGALMTIAVSDRTIALSNVIALSRLCVCMDAKVAMRVLPVMRDGTYPAGLMAVCG